ncbi:hypothetical protein [Flavobacterium daemonense]|uniref:hypothetical protein n=1 Tax=Flavobacterium daemonense TaxID=1393049 RepID=UPI001185D90D|nr:hypothetical protein [Flavobacterium daemonense]KAF2336142.1 hypothetical protein FND99_02345 [Flavobacterium daemonense]
MKNIILICSLIFTVCVNAQKYSENTFLKVSKKIEPQKLIETKLVRSKLPKKKPKCITYQCNTNLKTSFCNDDSDENYVEFQELGYIMNTDIFVINKFTYNEEFYILLNKKECKSLTLDGFPLKIENTNFSIVYNDPSTDQRKKIEILKMENGKMSQFGKIVFPEKIKLKKFIRLDSNEVYILDEKNQLWKTIISK